MLVDPKNNTVAYFRSNFEKLFDHKKVDKGVDKTTLLAILIFKGLDRIAQVSLKKMSKSEINRPLSHLQFSCLQLAIMCGNQVMSEFLASYEGVDINCQDAKGFTPLHHAAVTANDKMIDVLKKKKANESLKNYRNGTYIDLLCTTQFSHFFQSQNDNPFTSQEDYFKRVKAYFAHNIYTPAKIIADDYINGTISTKKRSIVYEKVEKQYPTFTKQRPKLALVQSPGIGFDVIAQQNIKKGEIICEYSGYDVSMDKDPFAPPQDLEYQMGTIDGDYQSAPIRGFGPLINDSFPNACSIQIENLNGRDNRPLIIALEDINKGDRICINYRRLLLKSGWHKELRIKNLEAFFNKHNISTIMQWIQECPQLTNNKHFHEITQFFYILSTPSALIRLFVKRIVTLEELLLLDLFPWDSKEAKSLWDSVLKPAFKALSKEKENHPNLMQAILKNIEENKTEEAIKLLRVLI
jgi:hypothetical protein